MKFRNGRPWLMAPSLERQGDTKWWDQIKFDNERPRCLTFVRLWIKSCIKLLIWRGWSRYVDPQKQINKKLKTHNYYHIYLQNILTFHQRRIEWSQLDVIKTFSFFPDSLWSIEVSPRGNNLQKTWLCSIIRNNVLCKWQANWIGKCYVHTMVYTQHSWIGSRGFV